MELRQHRALRDMGFGTDTHIVGERGFLPDVVRSLVGTSVPHRGVDHDDLFALEHLRQDDRLITWADTLAPAADLFLHPLEIENIEAARRQHGLASVILDPEDDIATVQALEVIGERRDRLDRRRADHFVPAGLEVDPDRFHGASVDEVFEPNGEEVHRQRYSRTDRPDAVQGDAVGPEARKSFDSATRRR
jgi:hypothetical protein